MKQLLIVGLLAALATAAIFVVMADARQPQAPTAQPAQVMAAPDTNTPKPTRTPNPEATSTPKPTGTPGPDYIATMAVNQERIDRLNAELSTRQAQVDAQARLMVDATMQAEQARLIIAQYTAEVARATMSAAPSMAPLTQTRQVIDDMRFFAGITAAAGRATQTAEYPAIIERRARAEASAKLAPVREATQSITWPLVIVCGAALIGYVIHKWARPIPYDTNEMDTAPVMIQETKTDGAFLEVMQYEVPAFLTREILCRVAAAIISGTPFSRSGLVDSHILTDGEWDSFRWWANRRGYAKPVRGDIENSPWYVTGTGHAFFDAFDLSPS